jgi:hypothetical protein
MKEDRVSYVFNLLALRFLCSSVLQRFKLLFLAQLCC